MTFAISSSGGNDSVAPIQWAIDSRLSDRGPVHVVFCDTGWHACTSTQNSSAGSRRMSCRRSGWKELVRDRGDIDDEEAECASNFGCGL